MDAFEVEFYLGGRHYLVPVSNDYEASTLVLDLEAKGILVTTVFKNGVSL